MIVKGYKFKNKYGTRINLTCIQCDKNFNTYPSRPNTKFCSRKCMSGWQTQNWKMENNPHWKGGRKISKKGKYIRIKNPSHPFCDQTGYVFEHRLVMEKRLKRYLKSGELVHHINENGTDNRIENLMLTDRRKHNEMHIRNRGFNGQFINSK